MTKHPATRRKTTGKALTAAIFAWLFSAVPAFAWSGVCLDTAARVTRAEGLPADMMASIAITESGRTVPESGEKVAWPWTVTSGGDGQYFPTKEAAIAEVKRLQRLHVQNIDVGCMQVNLKYHPDAFPNLEAAFDPETNVRYAARYLKDLRQATGTWSEAVRRYHSADDDRGRAYAERVARNYRDLTGSPREPAAALASADRPRFNSTLTTAGGHPRLAPAAHAPAQRTPEQVADLERKRAEARAEADAYRQKKLAEYRARHTPATDG